MASSGLSSALLLTAAFLLMRTAVSTDTVITCENEIQRLSCDLGVISVQEVLYGREDAEICSGGRPAGQLQNTQCSLEGSVDVVRRRCDGKRECEISTRTVQTSDPCAGTFKYLETNFTCVPAIHLVACERSLAHLHCDEGQVIVVYGADYGRRDHTTCSLNKPTSQTENVNCVNPTDRVANRCNGRDSCTIEANNRVFGDPCVGTYKYLEVAYVCDYPGVDPQ